MYSHFVLSLQMNLVPNPKGINIYDIIAESRKIFEIVIAEIGKNMNLGRIKYILLITNLIKLFYVFYRTINCFRIWHSKSQLYTHFKNTFWINFAKSKKS